MDYSLIDDLVCRICSPKMDKWEEEVLWWLVYLRTVPSDSPVVETRDVYNKHSLDMSEIINVISHYGDCNPCYDLHIFMLKSDFVVIRKDSLISQEPLFHDNYPKMEDLLGFYDNVIRNMEELVLILEEDKRQSHHFFNYVVNHYLKRIQRELQEFRPSLKAISDQRKEWPHNNDKKIEMTWITSLVYEVEYVTDLLLSKQCPCFDSAWWLVKVVHRLPGKKGKDKVDRIIKELKYRSIVDMELGSKESIINYVVSIDRHQIIPIINYDNEDIGEKLRQIFIDEKMVSTFDVCRWSLATLSDSEHLLGQYEDQLQGLKPYGSEHRAKVVKKYLMTLRPQEFKELVEDLLPQKQKYFVIFENIMSECQFELLRKVIDKSSSSPASKILYTTRDTEVALKCHFNCPKVFYIRSKTPDPAIGREVVGFTEEKQKMLEWLTVADVDRFVISISGMPGLGKTTLAKLLYNHPSVTQHFHARAFCTVSQAYKLRELLFQLVHQFLPANDALSGLEDVELASKIYKYLKGRRYLIILDDIWDINAWKDLQRCLQDEKIGSRIIITTRQTELMPFNIQSINLLSDLECWELLEKEIFQDQNFPEELTAVGKTIARNCKGLPLSVILIAGFLKKLDRTKAAWAEIAETLTLDLDINAQRKAITELSYKHLPDCLKPCFLYFGLFPEDDRIAAEKLIRLWSAEGFLFQKVGDDKTSIEDVAANYLKDLAGRSLVTVAEKNLRGRVKSYQVHDLIREFCNTKAQEEKFFLKLTGYEELSAYSDSLIENNLGVDENPIPSGPRRLAINCERKQFVETKLSELPLVRSMLFLAEKSDLFNNRYDVLFIYDYFKLLKILDLEAIIIGDSSIPPIFELVLLKYLAIQSDAYHIPGDLSRLWNLETLIFKSSKADRKILVPDSLWDMTKLRHVHISGKPDFDLDPKRVENTSTAVNPKHLQTFSTPSLVTGGKLEKLLPRLQSIRKLKCRFSDQSLDVANNGQFTMLDSLINLESLKVVYGMKRNFEFTSVEFKFPDYLTKLSLSNFCMPWKEISQLTKLKVLEVLVIESRAFKGGTWDMSEQIEAFEKLKVLKLEALDVVNWCGVNEEHFPKLKHLLLCNLEKLEAIPEEIGEIANIEMIEVKWCSSYAEESAKDIQIAQADFKEIAIRIQSRSREM